MGGGRITKIFLQAFKNSDIVIEDVVVYDPNTDTLDKLKNKFTYIKSESISLDLVAKCKIIFLAVHPPIIKESLSKIKSLLINDSLIVSLAPKVTIEKMKELLDGYRSIVRVNPSALGIINQGINPVTFSDSVSEDNKKSLLHLLNVLGKCPVVDESKIEAYAMINAMGPTYFWFQLQRLKELAISFGFEENEAIETISEMIKGTVNTLFKSEMSFEEVTDLIPVKPLGEYEETIKTFYNEKLNAIYLKIKP
ncbi:MAG: NAD(P)-binding domain-containing protein [Ignavibacteriae bacterium]|nr:NAD(P)-binding domain-containing protein [Ignavibacteriota bacterium]